MKKFLLFLLTVSPFAAKSQSYIENQELSEKAGKFWINGMGTMKRLSLTNVHNNGQILLHNGSYDANATKRRWAIGLDNAESGTGNTGSDFMLWNYNDAGVYKGLSLSVSRSSGTVNFHQGINLMNTTANYIFYTAAGYGAPAFTTRSLGTKMVLHPSVTSTTTDYAIGLEKNGSYTESWFGMPDNTHYSSLNFYGGNKEVGRIDGLGSSQWEGHGRFKGWYTGFGVGPAAEIGVSGTVACYIGYNRTSASYIPAYMAGGNGSTFTSLLINETGVGIGVGTAGTYAGKLSVYDAINGKSTITLQSASNSRFWIQEGGSILRIGGIGSAAPAMGAINVTNGGLVGIGTLVPQSELSVNGTITSKKVKVLNTGWADYVFLPDYQLPTLREVERHIREKGHLKDIPSEKEVEKEGVDLGEMNKKLLAKVEELTLYLIEQNKKLEALEKWKSEQEEKAGK
ncbi:hypothetical protein [Chitinophaga rhizosphaerae]|uniref:hypothetical protein n=1 Tax=Chitinophaga rhizosphaerae TaxID=1864947 RepID=UPI000F80979A|nr:hypothetical protein [Chitinophaga rhizosphaerae]